MSTAGNMSTFKFCSICHLAEFYGTALIVLAAHIKRYGWGGMRAVVLPA
jgi:hypothetical protein